MNLFSFCRYRDQPILRSAVEFARAGQVWSLTQIFCFIFFVKTNNLPGGQINDPSLGKHYSLLILPTRPSSPAQILEGTFKLTLCPSRAFDLPCALLPELHRNKDTVDCAPLGAQVPGHRQKQLMQTLIVSLFKNTLGYTDT